MYAKKAQDPLDGELPKVIPPGGCFPFADREENRDAVATALMTGGSFSDGSDRGFSPQNTPADGSCFFHAAAMGAFGMNCSNMRQVFAKALPLRGGCVRTALMHMESMLSSSGWGSFFCNLQAYDSKVTDRAAKLNVPITPHLPLEVARVFFLLAVELTTGEHNHTQQFCFPLLAETLNVKIRVFHPGVSVNSLAGGTWCKELFRPKQGAALPAVGTTPTVYLAMSLLYRTDFKNIQQFEKSCRVPLSPDRHGFRPAGHTHAFPEFTHFVALLPSIDADAHQRQEGEHLEKATSDYMRQKAEVQAKVAQDKKMKDAKKVAEQKAEADRRAEEKAASARAQATRDAYAAAKRAKAQENKENKTSSKVRKKTQKAAKNALRSGNTARDVNTSQGKGTARNATDEEERARAQMAKALAANREKAHAKARKIAAVEKEAARQRAAALERAAAKERARVRTENAQREAESKRAAAAETAARARAESRAKARAVAERAAAGQSNSNTTSTSIESSDVRAGCDQDDTSSKASSRRSKGRTKRGRRGSSSSSSGGSNSSRSIGCALSNGGDVGGTFSNGVAGDNTEAEGEDGGEADGEQEEGAFDDAEETGDGGDGSFCLGLSPGGQGVREGHVDTNEIEGDESTANNDSRGSSRNPHVEEDGDGRADGGEGRSWWPGQESDEEHQAGWLKYNKPSCLHHDTPCKLWRGPDEEGSVLVWVCSLPISEACQFAIRADLPWCGRHRQTMVPETGTIESAERQGGVWICSEPIENRCDSVADWTGDTMSTGSDGDSRDDAPETGRTGSPDNSGDSWSSRSGGNGLSEDNCGIGATGQEEGCVTDVVYEGKMFDVSTDSTETWDNATALVINALRRDGHESVRRRNKKKLFKDTEQANTGVQNRWHIVWIDCKYSGKPDPRGRKATTAAGLHETRKGCGSRKDECPFRVAICWPGSAGAPRITKVHMGHNHPLTDRAHEDPRLIPGHVVDERREDIRFWALCNVPIPKMFDMLRRDSQSLDTRGVLGTALQRKVRNMVDAMRRSKYASLSDALDFVKELSSDPGAYVEYTVDKSDRLEMLFWASSQQRELALTIGDVLVQDNTAQTNGAKLPFCAFVGVDKENKSRVICQALLPNEQSTSFEFALTHMIKVCGDLHPKVLLTDADLAMTAAVEKMLPGTLHLYCIWHIFKNITKNCASSFPERSQFGDMMRHVKNAAFAVSEEAFDGHWRTLLHLVDGTKAGDYLMERLYPDKRRWAFCYRLPALVLGMSATQRVESFFGVLKRVLHGSASLVALGQAIRDVCDAQEVETDRLGSISGVQGYKFVDRHIEALFQPVLAELKTVCTSSFLTQRLRREFGSAVAYNATVLASCVPPPAGGGTTRSRDENEVESVLRDLSSPHPLVHLCEAQSGLELVDLDVATEAHGRLEREDISMYARTSLRAFVDMLEESDVDIQHVVQVSYKLTETSGSHIVVLGSDGFHLCSCLQLLQHGFPCRHFFSVLQLKDLEKPTSCCVFVARSIHPRWRDTRCLEDESWTASAVVPDEYRWTAADGPTCDGDDGPDFTSEMNDADPTPKVTEGARKKVYADCVAIGRELASEVSGSVSPAIALDIFAAARAVVHSRLRAEGVWNAPEARPGSGSVPTLNNPAQATVSGRKKKKRSRYKSSTE